MIIEAKKIYRVLEFKLSRWLRQYVQFNTQKRIKTEKNRDKDEKVLYKLMNNAVYRKTMENLRNRINGKLVSNRKVYLKWASKPRYTHTKYLTMI